MFEKWEKICQIVILKCEISHSGKELTNLVHFLQYLMWIRVNHEGFINLALESMIQASISNLLFIWRVVDALPSSEFILINLLTFKIFVFPMFGEEEVGCPVISVYITHRIIDGRMEK